VGAEGVAPLSGVQPEKLLVARSNELCHMDVPSIPTTTKKSLVPTIVAAGPSMVVPVGNTFQPCQFPPFQVLTYILLSFPLTVRYRLLEVCDAVRVGLEGVAPLSSVQPENALFVRSTVEYHNVLFMEESVGL
jgi:hypothetical protein